MICLLSIQSSMIHFNFALTSVTNFLVRCKAVVRHFLKKKKKKSRSGFVCVDELANLGKWCQESQMSKRHPQDDRNM